jgi:hypothetical protein
MKCKVHGKTLIETTAFKLQGDYTPDSTALQILDDFPNSIHFDYSLQPDRWYKTKEQIVYCPDCESQARLARLQKQ